MFTFLLQIYNCGESKSKERTNLFKNIFHCCWNIHNISFLRIYGILVGGRGEWRGGGDDIELILHQKISINWAISIKVMIEILTGFLCYTLLTIWCDLHDPWIELCLIISFSFTLSLLHEICTYFHFHRWYIDKLKSGFH